MKITTCLFGLPLGMLTCAAWASDIAVHDAWLRATPKGATVAAGYATIVNGGAIPDVLRGASLPVAPEGEIHEMSMTGGVMKMRRLDKGLPIGPGQTVSLTPGGYHLMFVNPRRVLKEGETIKGELIFEKAGRVEVDFPVAGFGAKTAPDKTAPGGDADHAGHMKGM